MVHSLDRSWVRLFRGHQGCQRLWNGRWMSSVKPIQQVFLLDGGRRTGPYALVDLATRHRAGQMRADAMVWFPDDPAWIKWSDYLREHPATGQLAPPPLPRSNHSKAMWGMVVGITGTGLLFGMRLVVNNFPQPATVVLACAFTMIIGCIAFAGTIVSLSAFGADSRYWRRRFGVAINLVALAGLLFSGLGIMKEAYVAAKNLRGYSPATVQLAYGKSLHPALWVTRSGRRKSPVRRLPEPPARGGRSSPSSSDSGPRWCRCSR